MTEEIKTVRSNSATLIFGDTGTGKSSLIATYADYVWQKFGKITLLFTTDGGGYPTNVEALIHKGIIWVFKMRSRGLHYAFETCTKVSEGFWPQEIVNPITGEVAHGCKLLPMVQTQYTLFCPNGHQLKQSSDRNMFSTATLCSQCKTNTTSRNGRVIAQSLRTPGMEMIGGAAFDGLTSMQAWIMTDMAKRTAHGDLKGEETALGGKIVSGDETFGGSNRSHFGQAQLRAEDWILNSTAIPGLVVPPLWTALEQRATDRDTKLPVYGPKIAGSARTADVPSWVGNCLGTRIYITEKGEKEWRLYLTEYREEDNVPHLCKTRAMPGIMPEFLADDPEEPPFTKFNLGLFFDMLDEALEKTMKIADERYKNAPGLPSGRIGGPPKTAQTPTVGNGKGAVPTAGAPVASKKAAPASPPGNPSPAKAATRRPPSAVPAARKVSSTRK